MIKKTVKVFAPATIANVGPGFDVLGLAIDQPGDIVVAERIEQPEVRFVLASGNIEVPKNKDNLVAHVAQLMLDELKPGFGVALTLHKGMPIGSGLGSSGASAAATAFAVNALLSSPFAKKDLVRFSMAGEKLASGAAHADNVAPSLLGGICLITSYQPLNIFNIPFSNRLTWVAAHPHLQINTKDAREILPNSISIAVAMQQASHLAALISGLQTDNESMISLGLEDVIAEPYRAKLIPGYQQVKQAALDAGALGFSISGSGPSIFAVCSSTSTASVVAKNIQTAFKRHAQVDCDIFISKVNMQGAVILEESA